MASTFIKLPKVSGGGGGGAVDSFNGRIGSVVSQAGDYSAALISNTPAGTISSTNTQGAINELDSDIVATNATLASLTTVVSNKQPLDSDLTAIAALSSTGMIARTGSGTAATRTITGSTNISVANGDGVGANPTLSITGTIPVSNGGTGTSAAPINGQLLIGNGTDYTQAPITAGAGISVVNGPGSISISNTAIAAFINIDGGTASSIYGGTSPINAGGAI